MLYFDELLSTLNEMSPYLLLGFFISGLLHTYVPRSVYHKFLHRKGFGSVVGAALLGVPLPLCSCGVIPTAVSLRKEGASAGATVSFLVATPQTGVDSVLATYSLLGLPFAIIRAVAAFVVAIFSGLFVDLFGGKRCAKQGCTQGGYQGGKVDYKALQLAPAEGESCGCSCGCHHSGGGENRRSFGAALRYGYVDLMQDFGLWLVMGLLVAAAITAFVPESLFVIFREHYILNILLILLISAPMYICATGSIPVALSLMMKGVSPGAAFVLLMAGPATNVASLVVLRREIGGRKTIIYLLSIIVGAVLCALVIDYFLPTDWFSHIEPLGGCCAHDHDHHHHHDHELCTHGPVWWQTLCSAIFITLFSYAMVTKWVTQRHRQATQK